MDNKKETKRKFPFIAIVILHSEDNSKVIKDMHTVLATSESSATTSVAMNIPEEYKDRVDDIEIRIRPF